MTILSATEIEPGANLPALLAFFACLCGIYLFGQGLLAWRRRRRLPTAPVAAIRSIRTGPVEVRGSAEGPHTLSAALSGKDCFFYRTTIWREDSRKSGDWNKAAEETFSLPFFLADKTGRILLDPRDAEIDLPRDVYEEYGKTMLSTHTDIPENLEVFLSRHAVAGGSAIRVEEYAIAPGDEIFANGTVIKNTSGFDVNATPLNQLHGGYIPGVRSASTQEVETSAAIVANLGATPDMAATPDSAKTPHAPISSAALNEIPSAQSQAAEQPRVIRLSLPSPGEQPEEMTMQSRLAAALRRANASSPDTWGMPLPAAQSTSVAIQEKEADGLSKNTGLSQTPAEAVSESSPTAPGKTSPPPAQVILTAQASQKSSQTSGKLSRRPPALILSKGGNGSGLTLSRQSNAQNALPSGVAAALVIAGPALTLAGAYYLLLNFGWL